MPLYQYYCKNCGETFEKNVPWAEADRAPRCPKCESQETGRRHASGMTAFGSMDCGSAGPNF